MPKLRGRVLKLAPAAKVEDKATSSTFLGKDKGQFAPGEAQVEALCFFTLKKT